MAPITNKQVLLKAHAEGAIREGEVLEMGSVSLDLDQVSLNGGILVKTLAVSVDPYMKGKMRPPQVKSYSPSYEVGKPIYGYGIVKVVRSEHQKFNVGSLWTSSRPVFDFSEYAVYHTSEVLNNLSPVGGSVNLPVNTWLGAAGMPGKTAWYGLYEIGKPKKGETIFVTSAAGAVGQIVVQLAKREGLKVIASAGTPDKLDYLKSLGADVVFNYKTEDVNEILAREGPLDIYFDNTSGPQLDAALWNSNLGGRIIACGALEADYAVKNLRLAIGRELTIRGFIISFHPDIDAKFNEEIPPLIASGELKILEDISVGIETVERTFVGMLNGKNFGKASIKFADE
ncbi:alcohol dehydrogenase [Atractiella rhizophila]|nr:alcohol dehydrogenase [Atractiella rhizophila]